MKLNEIRNNPGAHKRKAKVGRGSSSGLGKTSGRGVKGAKARTGTKVYGFEGGQMPLHMRMLRKANLVHKNRDGVRLLGSGELKAKIDIEVAGASASARQAVERAGGTLTTTFQKANYMNKKGEPGKRKQRRAKAAEKRAARAG
jgi:large subunit ribosomal protein L15